MYSRAKLLTFLSVTLVVCGVTISAGLAHEKLTERSKLFINGIGPVKVGMTVAQASRAAGVQLVQIRSGGEDYGCFYFIPNGRRDWDILFTVRKGRIARIDVSGDRRIATVKGARIGDTEARLKSLYGSRLRDAGASSVGYSLLEFVPKDSADRRYRLVFVMHKQQVHSLRSGKIPEVKYEGSGCD